MQFSDAMPAGILPEDHGLPLQKAMRLFASPDAIHKEDAAYLQLWMFCRDEKLFQAAIKVATDTRPSATSLQPRICDVASRLREAITARQESFWLGLAHGALRAFAVAKGGSSYRWLSSQEATDKKHLAAYSNVHVADMHGIPFYQAIRAFCSTEIVQQLAELEYIGVGFETFSPDWEKEMLYRDIEKKGIFELAALLRDKRLVAKGVSPESIVPDPYTGILSSACVKFSLIRRPVPDEIIVKSKNDRLVDELALAVSQGDYKNAHNAAVKNIDRYDSDGDEANLANMLSKKIRAAVRMKTGHFGK